MDVSWLLVPLSYALGAFPTANLVGRLVGRDPTREGSGNPGASNVYRLAGKRAGIAVLVIDVCKGAVPAAVGLAIGGRSLGVACGLAAMAGHVLPVDRRFRGGKGVATLGGACLVLYPLVSLCLLTVWAAVMRVSRVAALGSLAMAALLPVGVAIRGRPGWEIAAVAAAAIVVIVRHRSNVDRLLRGHERTMS
ncbi:MAG: glycerol-3-phosphate 1-O-acyltransferase PlsY [Acidimicrobiales bacterium]